MDFSNKTAFITGASAGIGAEFAQQLHAAGARVVLVARRAELLNKLVAAFEAKRPGSAIALPADLASREDVRRVVDYIAANQIDILVNNAGRGSFGEFDQLDLDDELNLVSLNVIASLHLAHAIIPQMKMRKSGAIISLSSIAGFQPLPFMATYAATKAFNLTHSMALKYELASYGIRVLTVCPGPVDTEFAGVARIPGGFTDSPRDSAADVVRTSLKALARGSLFVVPGWRAKPLYWLTRLTPRSVAMWITTIVLKSTLKKHRDAAGH